MPQNEKLHTNRFQILTTKLSLRNRMKPLNFVRSNQARVAKDLIELRNKSVFAFFMFNALFVLIVFLMQLSKDKIHINWPFGVRTNITYNEETGEVGLFYY